MTPRHRKRFWPEFVTFGIVDSDRQFDVATDIRFDDFYHTACVLKLYMALLFSFVLFKVRIGCSAEFYWFRRFCYVTGR